MLRTSTRRELAFVLAVAGVGLALVLLVVFVPWYPTGSSVAAPPVTGHVSVADRHRGDAPRL